MRAGASDGNALRFGGVWTAVIVTQVAATVAFPAIALLEAREVNRVQTYDAGFAADEYLTAQLGRDPVAPPRTPAEEAAFLESSRRRFLEVRDRLAALGLERRLENQRPLHVAPGGVAGPTLGSNGAEPTSFPVEQTSETASRV